MQLVFGRRKFRGGMTLQADSGAGRSQVQAMRVMAIAAGDPLLMHAALEKRPVDIYFIENLSVAVIEGRCDQGRGIVIEKISCGVRAFRQSTPARMTSRARIDFCICASRGATCAVARGLIQYPCYVGAFGEMQIKPVIGFRAIAVGPIHVVGAGAMACFTRNI